MKKARLLTCLEVTICVLGIITAASAADYTFSKIFDSNDIIPGRTDTFTIFDLPSLDGRDVAFAADRNTDYSAVITYSGGSFNLVADSTTAIPGGVGNFDTLETPIIDKGSVVFVGTENSGYEAHGIYTDLGGDIRVVADHNTHIPGGTGNFGFFDDESHDFGNGVPAFSAWDSDFRVSPTAKQGVYAEINGILAVIANETPPIAGFTLAGVDGTNVAFSGATTDASGFYLSSNGTITTLIDTDTLIPGSTDTFVFSDGYADPAAGTYIVLGGPDYSNLGIYSNVGGALHPIAEIGDITPDGIGNFRFFDNLAVDGNEVAFIAIEDNGNGNIFRYADGTLDEVVSVGNILDGKVVNDLNMWNAGLDDGGIAFRVVFDDGSSGIYLATSIALPETFPWEIFMPAILKGARQR